MKYAANTDVSSGKSRAEIERTLVRYGCRQFAYGRDRHWLRAAVNRGLIEAVNVGGAYA